MKKIYYFLVGSGKVLFTWFILVIVSVSLYSLTIKGKVNYGNRCYKQIDESVIKNYKYDGITLKNGYQKCNTYYVEYDSELNEEDNIIFLVSLSKQLHTNNIDINIHALIECREYQLMSTIVDYKVSYTKTLL